MTDGQPRDAHSRAWLVACLAFVVHNLEEVGLNLPAWTAAHSPAPWAGWREGSRAFEWTVLLLSLAVCAFAFLVTTVRRSWSRPTLRLFAAIMLVNVVSHVTLSMISGTLMPGVITAVAVVAPVMIGILCLLTR